MAVEKILVKNLVDNPFNPRSYYNSNKIKELAGSIKENGIIRQLRGRRQAKGDKVELAFGGYVRRALVKLSEKEKNWAEIPVSIEDFTDEEMAIIAIEENLKRADMSSLDTAHAIEDYMSKFPDTKETELAKKLGMTQGNVSNMRRVLQLPPEILEKIKEGIINFTMGRELLILMPLKCGYTEEWDRKTGHTIQKERDAAYLCKEAVKLIRKPDTDGGYDKEKATVDGMRKAVYRVLKAVLKPIDKADASYYEAEKMIFDMKECASCPKRIEVYRSINQKTHFCLDDKCWDKKFNDHVKKAAEEAKKKQEADIRTRIAAAKQPEENISEKYPDETPADPDQDIDPVVKQIQQTALESINRQYLCHTCQNRWSCDFDLFQEPEKTSNFNRGSCTSYQQDMIFGGVPAGAPCFSCSKAKDCMGKTSKYQVDDDSGNISCKDYLSEADANKLKIGASIPGMKNAAGTRAELVDLHDIRISRWNSTDLKEPYANLSESLDIIEDPQDCLEKCTKGFHFGFDSEHPDSGILYFCSDRKCLGKKKGIFTRNQNAAKQTLKNAEIKAVKEAVEATTTIDLDHVRLIIVALLFHRSYYDDRWSCSHDKVEWWCKKLGIEIKKDERGDDDLKKATKDLQKALKDGPGKDLPKHLIEFILLDKMWDGEISKYRVGTQFFLDYLGVKIEKPKKEKKDEAEPVKA